MFWEFELVTLLMIGLCFCCHLPSASTIAVFVVRMRGRILPEGWPLIPCWPGTARSLSPSLIVFSLSKAAGHLTDTVCKCLCQDNERYMQYVSITGFNITFLNGDMLSKVSKIEKKLWKKTKLFLSKLQLCWIYRSPAFSSSQI